MTDYGHPVQFGAFLTPANADPDRVVALSRHVEQAGLDLVTFQDHPYQPAFLDTWTLLAYVAAATDRVRLAPNVLNLPLRPPAVVARAAASLDLLSGGRLELGLGSGAFWDAIEGMGESRRSPGDAVTALEEAITVIRTLWDTGSRGGARVDGEFYRLRGAKRGPAPAHPVQIWLGAYKPRMLRLTGRLADGWLPSAGYLPPEALAAANAVIDDAAQAAGRDPGTVRRLYNVNGRLSTRSVGFLQGPVDQWVEELTRLAVEDGIGTFILGSDDPGLLSRFGAEVAPAVRAAVERERRPPAVAGPPTGPAATPSAGVPGSASAQHPHRYHASFTVVPTPDDGTRLSGEQLLDEPTRPVGPAPDPERTYTAHQLASAQHLVDIHDHLRRELDQARDLVRQVTGGVIDVVAARQQVNQMALRQNRWTVGAHCAAYNYLLTSHHGIEDQAVFPRLRTADPRLGPVLDRLEGEHHVIHDVLNRVDAALVAFVGADDQGVELTRTVDALSDALLSHLAYEERELVEPLARTELFTR